MYTMLDSALVYAAMNNGSFGQCYGKVGAFFGMTQSEVSSEYLTRRRFTSLHEVLLGIDQGQTLEKLLISSSRAGTLESMVNIEDACYRSPLAWAVEFGWADAAWCLVRYGADPCRQTLSIRGNSTLLHLGLSGPHSQFS
jgi:hypothetical protein